MFSFRNRAIADYLRSNGYEEAYSVFKKEAELDMVCFTFYNCKWILFKYQQLTITSVTHRSYIICYSRGTKLGFQLIFSSIRFLVIFRLRDKWSVWLELS